jgi:hypothetical protein
LQLPCFLRCEYAVAVAGPWMPIRRAGDDLPWDVKDAVAGLQKAL